ncbi:hypothetical protein ACWGSK_01255 [Nocardiopsis sp. NPDC055551]|uniref:hypothetical protein n=1 Tax=Nocardiopsis sp. NPDC006832 TaxID=3157188 RepID=UPI0033E97891
MSLQPVVSMALMGLPAVVAFVALCLSGLVPRHRRWPAIAGLILIIVGGVLELVVYVLFLGFVDIDLPLWSSTTVSLLTWFTLVIGVLCLVLAATRGPATGSNVRHAPAPGDLR